MNTKIFNVEAYSTLVALYVFENWNKDCFDCLPPQKKNTTSILKISMGCFEVAMGAILSLCFCHCLLFVTWYTTP